MTVDEILEQLQNAKATMPGVGAVPFVDMDDEDAQVIAIGIEEVDGKPVRAVFVTVTPQDLEDAACDLPS